MGHTHRCQLAFKKKKDKKKIQIRSPSPESRVPGTGSDLAIGSDRDSGRDRPCSGLLEEDGSCFQEAGQT